MTKEQELKCEVSSAYGQMVSNGQLQTERDYYTYEETRIMDDKERIYYLEMSNQYKDKYIELLETDLKLLKKMLYKTLEEDD